MKIFMDKCPKFRWETPVTFAELYCLPMTMLCAVEGVTRAGVVDAAGVAGKSASEMGHSR